MQISGVKTSAGLTTGCRTVQWGSQIDLYSRGIWIQKFHICFSSHFIVGLEQRREASLGHTVARRRICGKVKLIPGLCLGVKAFARLKRRTTDEFLLFEPNNEAKPLGSECGGSHPTVS